MKGKKLLSLVAAAAMALTSLTGAMTATAADINGTLTVTGGRDLSTSASVEVNGEGEYTIELKFGSTVRYLSHMGYFTFSNIVDDVAPCKVDVNSIEILLDSAGSSKVTLTPSQSNTNLIPTKEIVDATGNGAELPSVNNVIEGIVASDSDSKYSIIWNSSLNNYYLYDKPEIGESGVRFYGIIYHVKVSSAEGVATKKQNPITLSVTKQEVINQSPEDVIATVTGNEAKLPVIYELFFSETCGSIVSTVTDELTNNGNLSKGYIGGYPQTLYLRARTEGNDDYLASFSDVIKIEFKEPSFQGKLNNLKGTANSYLSGVNESLNYTEDSKAALKAVLDEINSSIVYTSTQEEVDAAVERLQAAIDALVIKPASDESINSLKAIIKEAEALIESDYTSDSWASSSIATQISSAEKILAEEIPGYWSVSNAENIIRSAIDILVPEDTTEEKAALASSIEEAKKCELEDYTLFSLYKLSEALETAEALSDDALKSAIENAKAALDEAYAGLKKADTTKAKAALDKAIENAEAIDAGNYTADTYAKVTEAINAAKALSGDALNTEINAATEAIKDAVAGLEVKPTEAPKTEPEPVVTTPTIAPTIAPTTAGNVTLTKTTAVNAAQNKKIAEKAMKQAKITKLKAKSKAKKKVTVSWKKVKGVKGYQVQISANKNFKKGVISKKTSKNKITIAKKVKSKKTYYVRVRAYTTYKSANGPVEVYGSWNKKIIKVRVK